MKYLLSFAFDNRHLTPEEQACIEDELLHREIFEELAREDQKIEEQRRIDDELLGVYWPLE
jgi:hypothetical protein